MAQRYPDELRAAVIETYRLHGSTAAAEKHGVNKGTATKWAKAAGVATVATSATREATEARSAQCEAKRMDLKAWRLQATERLAVKADRYIDRLDAPTIVHSFGGKDNVFNSETLPEPPADVAKALMGVVKDIMQRVDKIVDAEDMTGATAAVSLLSAFAEQLGIGVMQDDDDDEEDTFDDEESSDEEAGNYSEE